MPRARKQDDSEEPLSRQALKAAVWYTVTKIAQEEAELSLPFAASEHFVAALAEVVFQQALSLGRDLERFAQHAGRLTINADDLATRRNKPMHETLTAAAIQHGLTLADIRADSASTSKAGASKAKAVKAPRLPAAAKAEAATKPKKEPKAAPKKKEAEDVKGKGKGKAKAVISASEDEDSDVQLEVLDEPRAAAGGFVKASALKNGGGKRRAVESSEDEEEGASDSSEEVGKRKGAKAASKKKRKVDSDESHAVQ
ncbi:hypothetical protein JCM8202v2_000470 [Rhodotorula sphaerocarpa]